VRGVFRHTALNTIGYNKIMLTIFTLPNDFVANVNTNATDVIGSLAPYLELIVGVLLAVLVVGYLISAISHHKS
jgi:hypothetical protein